MEQAWRRTARQVAARANTPTFEELEKLRYSFGSDPGFVDLAQARRSWGLPENAPDYEVLKLQHGWDFS